MSKYKNLYVLGTSHISKESVKHVKKTVKTLKPSIIALELDQSRYNALISKKKLSKINLLKTLGIRGFLLNFIGVFIEKLLAKKTGIPPGTEMKTAIKLAKKHNIKVVLIDQPIQITLKKLITQITRKEKLKFIKELILSLFMSKKHIEFDINKVPSQKIITKLIKETKLKFPTVYKIVVEERNIYMAKILNKLITYYPDKAILAIVGAGHEKDIIGELKSMN